MENLQSKLESFLGKSIADICPNHFHDLSQNHCAHFVSHAVDLSFSYHCREYQGGNGQAGNIRVHEIFTQCPRVGQWSDANTSRPQLVFVTRKNNVDLAQKKMGNIPQKHIGIFCDGHVYHYSNTPDKVVKWRPETFLATFQGIYSGDQGLFFGIIPGEDLELNVDTTGASVSEGIPFNLRQQGQEWFARALTGNHTDEFFVGKQVSQPAKGYHGIYIPSDRYYGPKYNPSEYEANIDHWSYLLAATAHCESADYMNLINTYDRAKFTFGFYQLAAHTPKDNLIFFFRALTRLPQARHYFPELAMRDGTLHRVNEDGSNTNLETEMDTGPNGSLQLQLFMNYLNAKRWEYDQQEVLQAARLMHWTMHDPEFRQLQVTISAEILQRKMSTVYQPRYDLDGASDVICTIIADIHHQGRASKAIVLDALRSANPEQALLRVNHAQYRSRNEKLAAKIHQLIDAEILEKKVYNAANNEFVAR